MKRMLIVVMACITFCFISTVALAIDLRGTDWHHIASVYPQSGCFVVILDGEQIIPEATCYNRFLIEMSNPNYNALVASILTAYATDSAINIRYDHDSAIGSCNAIVNRFNFK